MNIKDCYYVFAVILLLTFSWKNQLICEKVSLSFFSCGFCQVKQSHKSRIDPKLSALELLVKNKFCFYQHNIILALLLTPWVNYLDSLGFNFSFYKIERKPLSLQNSWEEQI